MNQQGNAIKRLKLITDVKSLRAKSKKVSKWQGLRTGDKLIKYVAWNEVKCHGLAAPQVGINKRVFILFDGVEYAIFVNPRIIELGALEEEAVEGCLSLPERLFKVRRPTSLICKDAIRIKPFELKGLVARAWLHELDHLNGKLISDIGEELKDKNDTTITPL